jgi:hypothetical protein
MKKNTYLTIIILTSIAFALALILGDKPLTLKSSGGTLSLPERDFSYLTCTYKTLIILSTYVILNSVTTALFISSKEDADKEK